MINGQIDEVVDAFGAGGTRMHEGELNDALGVQLVRLTVEERRPYRWWHSTIPCFYGAIELDVPDPTNPGGWAPIGGAILSADNVRWLWSVSGSGRGYKATKWGAMSMLLKYL